MKLNTFCQICSKEFNHLGSHIWHKHKIKAKDYKWMYGLDLNHSLTSEEVKLKKQKAYAKDRDKYINNLVNNEKSIAHRFKKGTAHKRTYFSEQSKKRALDNLVVMNNLQKRRGTCDICKIHSKHIESHMYNKHGLLVVNRDKFNNIKGGELNEIE